MNPASAAVSIQTQGNYSHSTPTSNISVRENEKLYISVRENTGEWTFFSWMSKLYSICDTYYWRAIWWQVRYESLPWQMMVFSSRGTIPTHISFIFQLISQHTHENVYGSNRYTPSETNRYRMEFQTPISGAIATPGRTSWGAHRI